jgi:microcin C transport system substrate-binding protein
LKFLLAAGCFCISLSLHAQEIRLFAFDPSGEAVEWPPASHQFPGVILGLPYQGTLDYLQPFPVVSIHPYDRLKGTVKMRPRILDDLYFESLLLTDPITGSERLYPLIARSLRVTPDFSSVVFELNSRARFQDGTSVRGEDIFFSYGVMLDSLPALKRKFKAAIVKIEVEASEIKFQFRVRDRRARELIALLGRMNVVKPNTVGNLSQGGVALNFTTTGPYRLTQVRSLRVKLVRDPYYWANQLPTRRGFFNFREIIVRAWNGDLKKSGPVEDDLHYLLNPAVQVPEGLSIERAYLYGFAPANSDEE